MEIGELVMLKKDLERKLLSVLLIILLIGISISINPNVSIISKVEAASIWIQTTDTDFINGTLTNVELVHTGNETNITLTCDEWERKYPPSTPSKRYGHAMTSIKGGTTATEDNILLFGGFDGSYYDETWIYDLSTNSWNEDTVGTGPSARNYHAMASFYNKDKVLLFGGTDGIFPSETWLDETWIYDLSAGSWTEDTVGTSPSARYGHAMATVYGTDQVVLFGGWTDSGYNDETWVYDLSASSWTEDTSGTSPSARCYHAMASIY